MKLEEFCLISSANSLTPILYDILPAGIKCHDVWYSVVKYVIRYKSTCRLYMRISAAADVRVFDISFKDGKLFSAIQDNWGHAWPELMQKIEIFVDEQVGIKPLALAHELENMGFEYDTALFSHTYSKEF